MELFSTRSKCLNTFKRREKTRSQLIFKYCEMGNNEIKPPLTHFNLTDFFFSEEEGAYAHTFEGK